jgi:hypothetical protein
VDRQIVLERRGGSRQKRLVHRLIRELAGFEEPAAEAGRPQSCARDESETSQRIGWSSRSMN